MLTEIQKVHLLKEMVLSGAKIKEAEKALKCFELLRPSLKVMANGRIMLGLGHLDKTPLGLYRTLKGMI